MGAFLETGMSILGEKGSVNLTCLFCFIPFLPYFFLVIAVIAKFEWLHAETLKSRNLQGAQKVGRQVLAYTGCFHSCHSRLSAFILKNANRNCLQLLGFFISSAKDLKC